ncbi:MAG: LysM peptidoglycan-binding domain-containing protein [Psychromonas sp.]|nr:LysM peptidoglycan-binding domain-containing protein [Psychromonas sp.]
MIRFLFLLTLCMAGFSLSVSAAPTNQLKAVRTWPSPDSTRVVLDLSSKPDYSVHYLKHPARLLIDLKSTRSQVDLKKIKNSGPLLKRVRKSASGQKGTYRLVLDLNNTSKASIFLLAPEAPYGYRLVLDLPHKPLPEKVSTPEKQQTAGTAGRDILIAIDAGHGGEDPGALGKYSYEKNITLAIAKRLQKRVNRQKGMHAFLIRTGDYFINLNKRSAIARKKKADFLVSIHADGFTSSQPRGASVWVLSNRRATTELGRWMEKNEAHSELLGGAGDLIQDSSSVPFLAEMFLDMSMGNAMDVGYHVGDLVVNELKQVTPLHKKRPVHASLAVLKSPDIPSILVEAGFITNRTEEKLLNQPQHQKEIANAVFKGIYKHFIDAPPQHTLFAQKKRAIKHTVRSGESLSLVAARYSVSTQKLQAYNNLQSSSLRVGQVIKIPPDYHLVVKPEPVVRIAVKPQKEQIYKVKRGESLSVIAQRYGKSSSELKAYNNLRSTSLLVGQKLKIPGASQAVEKALTAAVVRPVVHKVKRGESLSVIASRFGTTVNALKEHNKLRSTSLLVGQKIRIPVSLVQFTKHKVRSGESLSVIASRYGTTTEELKAFNKLRTSSLAIGQVLTIPVT